MDTKLGTVWVAPGEGATVARLFEDAENLLMRLSGATPLTKSAFQNLAKQIKALGQDHRTDLALTGAPLTDYDLKRIAVCE